MKANETEQLLDWVQVNSTGQVPTPRSGHTITTVGDKTQKWNIMFGGLDLHNKKNGKLHPNNQVYTIKVASEQITWSLMQCSGDIPLERSNHAACQISGDRLFIFGGYYTSNLRFNDAYMLKVPEMKWSQPGNQKSGNEPKNAESKIGAPEPRANHTANFHKGKVYIFGGHGGVGYQRSAFNDIYTYDIETFEWNKLDNVNGTPPGARGGHSSSLLALNDMIMVYGGWSNSTQFSDIWVYDINNNEWVDPELSHDVPRWYHSGICVSAIPTIPKYKYFIFGGSTGNFEEGGNRTTSKMTDDSYFLDIPDIKNMAWHQIKLKDENNRPKARENAAMFYDPKFSRLVIFGGWANNWLGDCYSLKVSMITGPPYTLYSMEPSMGPLTGKTKVTINGDGFYENRDIVVRFESAKSGVIDVAGTYISDKEIECESPPFDTQQTKPITVTMKISQDDFTITNTEFTYYLNTSAETTIAYGPGLLHENAPGVNTVFYIQARNKDGKNRESGNDKFVVKMNYATVEVEEEEEEVKPKEEAKEDKEEGEEGEEGDEEKVVVEQKEEVVVDTSIPCNIEDMKNGTYKVTYMVPQECKDIEISVLYIDEDEQEVPIRSTQLKASFVAGANPKNNDFGGTQLLQSVQQNIKDIANFITSSRENINIRNKNLDDVYQLLQVQENLQIIQSRKEEYQLKLECMSESLLTLKKYDMMKEDDLKKTQQFKDDWLNLQKMSSTVEKDIAVQVKSEADKQKDLLNKFEEKLKEYYNKMKKSNFHQYQTGSVAAKKTLYTVGDDIEVFEKEMKDYEYFSKMFNFEENMEQSVKNLQLIVTEKSLITRLWNHIEKCQSVFDTFFSKGFIDNNPQDLDDEVKKLRKELTDIKGIDRKSNTFQGLNDEIKKWATFLPLLGELKDPSMQVEDDRHWSKVRKLVGKDFKYDNNLTLQFLWDLKLFEVKDSIEDITDTAKQELKIGKQLKSVIDKWKDVTFDVVQHKDTTIQTLKMIEENFEALEEHQMLINNMLLSKFVGYFEKEVEQWKQDLGAVYEVVSLLSEVQKTWSFLENLFIGSEEVQKELPRESEQFVQIDIDMKKIMAEGVQVRNTLKFCTIDGMLPRLQKIEVELKVCEKALYDFLDGKRRAFPRFYFVSVNDLLDILSNGNNPDKVNKHCSKIYQAIKNLTLKPDGDRFIAEQMISCVGTETVDFTKPLKLLGKVEVYMQDIIDTMRGCLRDMARTSMENRYKLDKVKWIEGDPAQISLLINAIDWSNQTEKSFTSIQNGDLDALKTYHQTLVDSLSQLIKLVLGNLTKPMRQKIMVLITADTHSRDVIQKLIDENVRKAEEFQWQSQLKFYWIKEQDNAQTQICDARFWYSYEYLGNGARLVVTPLTDRIYVTATQALHLCMGCAPAGPAGTGKTESTKDLANALAKACYVFNCSGEMNYESMGNIFKGLASSGCWGCFDEFNRLVPEVLSVCSVQFKAVTDGVKYKSERIVVEGDDISLDPTCGAFITMNPGYLGRSELPEGLKALFRPITVCVPDLGLICENMLMAEGFVEAKILSKKFVTLYMLSRDLLSKADHYDWGLRAIKSVLVVAGAFKRAEPTISEQALLMRALRDFNIPKIVAADLDIFFGLLGDLFPKIEVERKRDMSFEAEIEKAAIEMKLYPDPEFILKVVQLGELLVIRHCVFVMGPPGAGKSSCWKVLAAANDRINNKTEYIDLNPKVVSTQDLYGYMLPSKEWKDGLFSKLLRTYSEAEDGKNKWVLLDGDLDANWIESMNSVMDDNKILTLANNERITVKTFMRLIYEIRDLKHATPATVSRAGILYISDDDGSQWRSFVKSWIEINFKSQKETAENLQSLFNRYVPKTLDYLRIKCKFLIPVNQISMVVSLCRCLKPILEGEVKNLEYFFVFSLIWCLAGGLSEKDGIDYRREFSAWWKSEWKTSVKFPAKGTVFDYYVLQNKEGIKFDEWTKKVQTVNFDTSLGHQMGNFTIPTRETVATSEFINTFLMTQHPVLLIGNAGAGKTQLANGILQELTAKFPENYTYTKINFNFYTDANYLQNMLEGPLEKKAGKQFGPKAKLNMIYYIDDLNMPQLDTYLTQTAIALLRQHADYQHWYDISKLTIKEIVKCQHLASMNPSAGSFSVNPRYQRHFWLCSIPFPDNESLFIIYNTFLGGHLKQFKPSVQEQAAPVIKAALQIHQNVVNSFRKTAINFHYEFNIRHISNVFNGLLITQSAQFQDPEKLLRLWIHESERTYGDRLVDAKDLALYKSLMYDLVKKQFAKFNFSRYFQPQNQENLIFCNFTNGIAGERNYDQMPNDKLEFHLTDALKEYNDINVYMGLVLFEDAMKHVCKICRIVMPAAGHALLVGVGGSGKQSLSKLASFIMGFTTYMITISATYSMADLRTDLQMLYNKTGVKDEGYMFLFNEGQITNERFLVYINDLLASGEIAELYTTDEKEVIINSIRAKVKADGIVDTRDNCWNWFINKVRVNLHMSLCFSPAADFRIRARKFPALVNSTVIDWFQPWPQDALLSVATQFLEETDLGEDPQVRQSIIQFMPYSFTYVNEMSKKVYADLKRYVYTTPKSFLELIKLYQGMLANKRNELEKAKERYETGLIKLQETSEQVQVIEEEVKIKQVDAEAKKKEAEAFAEIVGVEKAKVQIEADKATIESDKCGIIKKDVTEKKLSTEADLEAAGPLVEQAKAALKGIQKSDFQTAKSFSTPPGGVPEVFAACMYLLAGYFDAVEIDKKKQPKDVTWKSALKLMKSPEVFLDKLLGFQVVVDANQVPDNNVKYVKNNYLNLPDFKVEILANKSGAAKGLCSWVINIVSYYDVIQDVEPKRKALAESTTQLEEATTKLDKVTKIVNDLNASLSKLISDYDNAMAEKDAALAEASRCATRLDLAQRLVSALGSENARWANSIVKISEDLQLLTGDVLMASAFISYAGPFNKQYRHQMIDQEFLKYLNTNNIPRSPNVDPVKLLADEASIANWNKQGLPADRVSTENGTILTNSVRYSLMIDPQLQGITWIREKEKNNSLKSLRLGSKNIIRELEICIENGYSAMIENMGEKIDAILMPVVSRSVVKKGKNSIMKFGGKDLILHDQFKLFLHTKLSNPHYPPEIQAETTLINFMVTEDGLADQLLTLVVGRERPDLARIKLKLIQQQNEFKIKLNQLETDLLFKLANAKGDILDDIELILNLENSKKISVEVAEKVEIAKATEIKINVSSETYRGAAERGALVYFLLNDLNRIHTFYKFSLESFIVVVNRSIDLITDAVEEGGEEGEQKEGGEAGEQQEEEKVEEQSQEKPEEQSQEKADEENDEKKEEGAEGEEEEEEEQLGEDPFTPRTLNKRVERIVDSITLTSFKYCRRGLFEKHKIIVSTMLALRILVRQGKLSDLEVNHLILGKTDLNAPPTPDVLKNFLTEVVWQNIKALEQIPVFGNICQSLEIDSLQWKKWYNEEKAESADLPKAFKDISRFHRLLLLRAMRPDRLSSALYQFIQECMGTDYVEQQVLNMDELYYESGPSTPIFFVLFPGVDPTPEVEVIARNQGKSLANGKLTIISMGQGQEIRAKNALFAAAKEGNWIMLQNVHLMQTWLIGMNGLEGMLEQVQDTAHQEFRCLISSEPPGLPDMDIIPESILQAALKVANESPQALKANIRRAYGHFSEERIQKCPKVNEFKAILFGLCIFHSLILGRKKFGAQGWSRGYNFNDGDLNICADVLNNYLSVGDVVPYDDLRYLFGEIMYGGHITDNWDRRTNETYLKVLIRPEILQNMNFIQGFAYRSPDPAKHDYEAYRNYIENKLPLESPVAFGLHPNAEIGYLTDMCNTIFMTITDVQGGGGGGSKKGDSSFDILMDLKNRVSPDFNMLEITAKLTEKSPYVVVSLQECERMNKLLGQIKETLEELRLGLTGALNVTDAMEVLSNCLTLNKVPPSWEKVAYFSKKPLGLWFNDLIERNLQLQEWVREMVTPLSLNISYLFNPMSFLTAIMQFTSRQHTLPLDNMILQTDVTQFKEPADITEDAADGRYIHGLYLEGAAWELGAQGQQGYLIEQKMKELHPKVPVINVISVKTQDQKTVGQYQCPVYVTSMRGPTYVFVSNLSMESEDSDPNKWILSGTCLLMSDD